MGGTTALQKGEGRPPVWPKKEFSNSFGCLGKGLPWRQGAPHTRPPGQRGEDSRTAQRRFHVFGPLRVSRSQERGKMVWESGSLLWEDSVSILFLRIGVFSPSSWARIRDRPCPGLQGPGCPPEPTDQGPPPSWLLYLTRQPPNRGEPRAAGAQPICSPCPSISLLLLALDHKVALLH